MPGVELSADRPVPELVDLAAVAADEGFDDVYVSCHYDNRDPFLAAGRIAAATEDVRVGPAAANPYETHPVALTARLATLQEVADGRALAGVAPGDRSTLSSLGIERDRPLRRVLETMRVARRLWRGETVTHHGTFAASDASLNFSVEPPPVHVGAQGPDMLRMAGKHAEAVLFNAAHPLDLEWGTDRIAEGAAERPDGRAPIRRLAYTPVSVAADADAALAAARPPVAFVAGGATAPLLERHEVDPDAAAAVGEALERDDYETAFEAVTPSMLEAFAVAGTVDDVAEELATLAEHVDDVVVGAPLGPDPRQAITLAARALRRANGGGGP